MTLFKNIISSTIFLGIFALHPSLNKGDTPITTFQHFVYGNSLNVTTNNSIDKKFLEVKWICKIANDTCKNLTVFKNGKQINEIPSKKGSQKLAIFYKGIEIGELPQNKKSRFQAHQFNIELLSKDNSLFFRGNIKGPTPYNGAPVTIATL
jgi:hypothetical protein